MVDIVTHNVSSRHIWIQKLSEVITEPDELLKILGLNNNLSFQYDNEARKLFSLRVPKQFISRMKRGDPQDPLLLQVLTVKAECDIYPNFSTDPLKEQNNQIPNLLHKYHNRALILIKGDCAIHCRYCFRRHFPYKYNQGNKKNWLKALEYVENHRELNEVIFSGGDPLMAKDSELDWLIGKLESIPHIKRLRIHSRLPVVIPERITNRLCERLARSHLKIIMVMHINHANEIDDLFKTAIQKLKKNNITLLNQSVLLRGVNNDAQTLANLSNILFDVGILPYYLHVLDTVQGAAHFLVSDQDAQKLIQELLGKISGYLVPKLVREIYGKPSKTLLDLN
ncbi:L-lysine 2,3-aminomutase [Candidatus Hartigia pinicola]|nr:L-lysine 2,3-aminomutase [Candidatus Hartigia pinicola]